MKLGAMGFFVKNLDVMVKFYRDIMNMKLNIDMEGFAGFVTEDGFFFNLCTRSERVNISSIPISYPKGLNGSMQISFNVQKYEDVDKEYERLVKAGATPVSKPISMPYGLREAYVADPEGNLVEIVASKE
ncbi:VOC family protein [Clostridium sp. 'deep sea']|uniref:VOC family protein n=1 Tax=Clostridium sp. 'deep sea' TaxID=2779445 RepID=UPI0018964463|nr:VOC family protein [Clostridium sp. 'deep sea']QOR36102.1 VOC family protein [Clostridium sp. 'deep sea']